MGTNNSLKLSLERNPANIYMFKVINRSTRKRCEVCSKLTTKNTRTTSMTSISVLIKRDSENM